VTFSEGTLTIRAQHAEEGEAEEGTYVRRELARGNLVRQIGLPGQIQDAAIKASVKNGLLEVVVPKEPRAQPKRISVSGGGGSKQLT
jgi:HSP20 family protein